MCRMNDVIQKGPLEHIEFQGATVLIAHIYRRMIIFFDIDCLPALRR
jgi:hypothetical protein